MSNSVNCKASKPKASLYIRVGSESQLETEAQRQEKELIAYAEMLGYEIVGKTIVCGTTINSLPHLERLAIDREYRGNADVILSTNPSRLSRDMHSLLGVTNAFSKAGIHLAFADGTGDLSERLGFLTALQIPEPEVEEPEFKNRFDPVDIDEGLVQSM